MIAGLFQITYAEDITEEDLEDTARLNILQDTLENYSISYRRNIALGSPFIIDLNQLQEIAQDGFSDVELRFQWEIQEEIQENTQILNYVFDEAGTKDIELTIFGILGNIELPVYQSDIEVFVFSEAMIFVVEENMKNSFDDFKALAKHRGVLIDEVGFFREEQLQDIHFGDRFREFRSRYPVSSDYIVVLGSKEFSITFLRHGNIENTIENIALLSSYNRTLFREYFRNSFSDVPINWNAFLLSDIHLNELLRYPVSYINLKQSLIQNGYSLLDLRFDMRSHPLFFLSSQIQYLGRYLTQSELYLLLLIPFFITAISISKHLIGINTLGIIIPVFLTYLMIDIGILEILILFIILGIINILIAQYLNRYALLYTPKISFLIICNILLYFLIGHLLAYFNIWQIEFHTLITFIFFIIISERFLVIVTSKELPEYSGSIFGTLFIAVILALGSSLDIIRVILFSYPELLIFLLPINFYLAQFTGLRITEYLRFKEVMRDIEE
ncbi:hypothetical protein LAT59_01340 [Candidatus Gracilibacteria bacterium]|nr:hypothetical protein [Candidatus Gracilibacteria bacterium]